jgi:hypothetical protein
VTGPLRMCDEACHGHLGCGAAKLEVERDPLERTGRASKVELVCDAERRAYVDLRILDRYVIEWRKLRQLGEQSERRARHDVLERSWGEVFSSSLDGLVGLDAESADPSGHVQVAVDPRDGPLRQHRLLLRALATLLVGPAHLLQVDPTS